MRTRPPDGDTVTIVPYGKAVEVFSYDATTGERWAHVHYRDLDGWMLAQYLAEQPVKPQPAPTVPPPSAPGNEQDAWKRCLAFILRWEGGWANDPNDPGGATMKGITFSTYKRWRKARGQSEPTKDDLRNIPDSVVEAIYYQWYWLESGANKLAWPLCLAQMDTAVNAGTGRAAEMLGRSNGNFLAYMGHVITYYATINGFAHFGRAWMKRRADLLLEASK